MIAEDQLQILLQEFNKPRKEFGGQSYHTRRREWFDSRMENIKPYLEREKISNLTIDEAMELYRQMSVGGPKLYPNTFQDNGIEKIRKSLFYLLYGDEPLEERFYNFAYNTDSEYKLNGTSRAFASTALILINSTEYGIWNSAIDKALQLLGLFPKKERGEHQGQFYLKILKIIKDLTKKLNFEDLGYTDEFLELIAREKMEAVTLPPAPIPLIDEEETSEEEATHTKIQWLLIKIGILKGNDVWVARNDINRGFNGEIFSGLCLKDIPQFTNPEVLKIAEYVDVIWFKKKSTMPIHFFEIETSTSIYSGLLRLNDIKIDYPIPKASIVSSKNREDKFKTQINRKTFVFSELNDVCEFKSDKEIESVYHHLQEIKKIGV